MDLHPSVLAWISTLPPEERRDYMVQLQLAFSAEAANSTAPTASVESLPLTAVEPPTTPLEEDSLPEESREWAPPDAEELASYRHQPLEPQAEPEHSEPHSNSMPERTEEFISTAEISPRDEPSEPEQANAEETEPQPNLEETTPQDTPAQPEPSSPQVQTPPESEPQQQQQGPNVPIQQNTSPVVKPAAKPPPVRLPQVTPQQPSGPAPTAPSPAKAAPDSPVAVKAKPPKPIRQAPKPDKQDNTQDSMAQPPSVPTAVPTFHMDHNKQPSFLKPDEDETDPHAAPSTAPATVPNPLPVPPICPPGRDVWWIDRDITSETSPRHQPKPEGEHWYSHDGSWWRNFWPTHGDTVPPEAIRAIANHYQYSHDPAFYKNTRIWVHPRKPEHEAFFSLKTSREAQTSAVWKSPPAHPSTFPQAIPPNLAFTFPPGAPDPVAPFKKLGQSQPPHLYRPDEERKALRQLYQGYSLLANGRWNWAPRTAQNSRGSPVYGYLDDKDHYCCGEPCGVQPFCPIGSLCGKFTRGGTHWEAPLQPLP